MTEDKCPVCVKLVDVCKDVGEGAYCADLLNKLYDNKLTSDQFVTELLKNPKVKEKLQVKES